LEIPRDGLTFVGLEEAIRAEAWRRYRRKGTNIVCRACGTGVDVVRGTASVCFERHGRQTDGARYERPCGGGGDVEEFYLPFCPRCEGKPKQTSTCVHTLPPLPNRGLIRSVRMWTDRVAYALQRPRRRVEKWELEARFRELGGDVYKQEFQRTPIWP
jgi:hypothetical protein